MGRARVRVVGETLCRGCGEEIGVAVCGHFRKIFSETLRCVERVIAARLRKGFGCQISAEGC